MFSCLAFDSKIQNIKQNCPSSVYVGCFVLRLWLSNAPMYKCSNAQMHILPNAVCFFVLCGHIFFLFFRTFFPPQVVSATEKVILKSTEVVWPDGPRMRAVKIPQGEKMEVYIYLGPDFLENEVGSQCQMQKCKNAQKQMDKCTKRQVLKSSIAQMLKCQRSSHPKMH